MDIKYTKYPNGYVKVKELIHEQLDRPKHRSQFLPSDGTFIPIITITTEV